MASVATVSCQPGWLRFLISETGVCLSCRIGWRAFEGRVGSSWYHRSSGAGVAESFLSVVVWVKGSSVSCNKSNAACGRVWCATGRVFVVVVRHGESCISSLKKAIRFWGVELSVGSILFGVCFQFSVANRQC